MKKLMYIFAFLLLLSLSGGFTACESEDSTPLSFTPYVLQGDAYWDYSREGYKNVILINSNEKLKQYIAGTDYPAIDFTKHTLVLLSGATAYGVAKTTVNDFRNLSGNKYVVDIEVLLTIATVAEGWRTAILTDKLNDNSEILLNVTMNH